MAVISLLNSLSPRHKDATLFTTHYTSLGHWSLTPGGRSLSKRRPAGEQRCAPQVFFDAQQLVVFRNAISAGQRTRLDLSSVGRDGQVRDEWIFSFARAM